MTNKKLDITIDFELIWKSLHGCLNEQEQHLLDQWLLDSNQNQLYFKKVEKHFLSKQKIEITADLNALKTSIAYNEYIKVNYTKKSNSRLVILNSVAAAIILVVCTLLFFPVEDKNALQPITMAQENPLPSHGTKQAILHLGGNKTIILGEKSTNKQFTPNNSFFSLDKGALAYKKETAHSASKSIAYHELEVPTGGEFMLTLSDGTKVWINAESSLKYPTHFTGEKRVVELTGEAYFEVAHNSKQPFEVISANQSTIVLGTSFNITSYPTKATVSTLLEGKISITTSENETAMLAPGEQTIYHAEKNLLQKKQVNAQNFVAWKNGLFYFHDESLNSMMEVLARWYNVEVVYKNSDKKQIHFTGTLKRYGNFRELLNLIEMTGDVKFTIKDNNKVLIE